MMADFQRALVVDDEPGIRYFVVACLEMLEFECVEASSGEEAITEAEDQTFDVIFMDVRMPGMGGLEAIRALRQGGVSTKIIVLSAMGGPEVAAVALSEMGADAFLSKPCTVSQIHQAVENVGAVAA